MSLVAKKSEGSPPIEAGTYPAVCYSVIDLGTQYNEYWGKSSPQIVITWEIQSLRIEYEKDGEKREGPRVISKTYTNVLHEKSNLYKDLLSWRGKPFTVEEAEGFDVSNVLGANCILTIINVEKNGRTYANIAGVSKLMTGLPKKQPENELVKFDITDTEIPESIPDWIKKLINKCEEFNHQGGQDNPSWVGDDPPPITDDDIPF